MSVYVVDSSVVVKWFVPEVYEAEALRVRDGGTPMHAPNFLNVEGRETEFRGRRSQTEFGNEITRTREIRAFNVTECGDRRPRKSEAPAKCISEGLRLWTYPIAFRNDP